jgi:hypothetical protein
MKTLHLNLNGCYFDQIKSGEKKYEYRLYTDYWVKRLTNNDYDKILIKRGYPRSDDKERIIERPWRGFEIDVIQHVLFGEKPVTVFAIRVN